MRIYRKILENIILPISGIIMNDSFIWELRKLRKIVSLSENELNSLHNKKLKKILDYATKNVEYYKNIHFNENDTLQNNLKKFPILRKSDVKLYSRELIADNYRHSNLIKHSSSGSTGEQTSIYVSKKEQSIARATQILWWEWAGYKIGQPVLQTGINPNRSIVKYLKDFLFRTKYVQAFNHRVNEVISSIKWAKNKNTFFAGYASSLYVFSKIAEKNNLKVNFNGVVSFGDKLFDNYKNSINKNFKSSVNETYGSAELLMMGAQFDIDYMYLMTPNVHIEILDNNDEKLSDGMLGNIVVTNLNAFSMPLIRYKIGDIGIILPKNKYPKKRKLNLPIIQKIVGRDTDIVKTTSGDSLVVHSFTGIFEHIPEIKQFCIIQNNLYGIEIEVVPGKNFSNEILKIVETKIQKVINEDFKIDFKIVKNIKSTPSGKPQIIISNLNL